MFTDYKDIEKAVIRSQHCQRNFDLTKTIPDEDIALMVHSAVNCPSKQNVRFYNLHVIQDMDLIKKVHELTTGVTACDTDGAHTPTTNSQTLANVLFVYEKLERDEMSEFATRKWNLHENSSINVFNRDVATSIGISAGYVNLTASLLGYATGCCQCYQVENIKNLLGLKNEPLLLMGIGYKDDTKNRREHATESNLMFPTRKKELITVTYK